MIKKLLLVLLISMLPIAELRGGIPVGCGNDLAWWISYITAVIGNLIPVPFILWFIPQVLDFMENHRIFPRLVGWVRRKALKGVAKLQTSSEQDEENQNRIPWKTMLALYTFVAIPLPVTGAWTGSLVASVFGMKKKYALPTIILGVLTAGAIVAVATYGGVAFLSWAVKKV